MPTINDPNVNEIRSNIRYKFENKQLNLFFKILDFYTIIDNYNLDPSNEFFWTQINRVADELFLFEKTVYTTALSERESAISFFTSTIDQIRFSYTEDGELIRRLIINWYAALRTIATLMKKGVDPLFLSTEDLDELIQSFGFPYARRIISRSNKIKFLYNIIMYMHKKGTPYVFGEVLQHFGLQSIVITEWWLRYNPTLNDLYFRSIPAYPQTYRTNELYIEDVAYDDFNLDIFWKQTKEELLESHEHSLITLPSITPYIDIYSEFDILKLRIGSSITARIFQESYTYWLEYVLQYNSIRVVKKIINNINEIDTSVEENLYYLYIIGDEPVGEFLGKSGLIYLRLSNGWNYVSPNKNEIYYIKDTDTHSIYNGIDWVHFNFKFPETYLNNTKLASLYKPIQLTDYNISVSLFELLLILSWIFRYNEQVVELENKDLFLYRYRNSSIIPFDKEYTNATNTIKVRDNIIDDLNLANKIYEDYQVNVDNIDFFKGTDAYTKRQSAIKYLFDNFTEDYSGIAFPNNEESINLLSTQNVEKILEAVNPELKTRISSSLISNTREMIIDSVLIDVEKYLYDLTNIYYTPFSFLLSGFDLFKSYKHIIDFFKPYRARINRFTAGISINDRPGESALSGDSVSLEYYRSVYDQAPGRLERLDTSPIKDMLIIKIKPVI